MTIIYDICPECGNDLDEDEDGVQECRGCGWYGSEDD